MDFKKIKFNKSGMSLEVSYDEYMEVNGSQSSNEVVKKCNMIVHKDFIDAFSALKVHFALLCDLREVAQFPDDYTPENFDHEVYLDNISISGITIGGDDDNAGVVIVGQKELTSRGILNMVTPFTRFDSDYLWAAQLEEAVGKVCDEANAYLGGKLGVKQLEFDFDQEFTDEAEPFGTFEDVAPKSEKKKGRKKKVDSEVLETAC